MKVMRKNKKHHWALMLLASTPISCWAEVDMLTGGFQKVSWDPLSDPPSKIRHRRSYQSRSLYNGIFGFGWCSEFEKSLKFNGDSEIELSDCQSSESLIFTRTAKNLFIAGHSKSDQIVAKDQTFERYLEGQLVQVFDQRGRLLQLVSLERNCYIYYGKFHRISKVTIENGETIHWKWDQGKVISLSTASATLVQFHYKNQNLIEVNQSHKNTTEKYEYSSTHNLVQDGKLRITYNEESDIVTSIKDKNCLENFRYTLMSPSIQSTFRKRTCKSIGPKTEQFRFTFGHDRNGDQLLVKVEVLKNNRTQVYKMDEKSGNISVRAQERRHRVGELHE
jgi:hypothetical protein